MKRYILPLITLACLAAALAISARNVPAVGETFSFAAAGDFGSNSDFTDTLDNVAAATPDFMLALGDLSYGQVSASAWCDAITDRLGAGYPFQLVAGNHDDDSAGGGSGDIADIDDCLPNRMTDHNFHGSYGANYFFDYNDLARFIMIAPDLTVGGHRYTYKAGTADYEWLKKRIDVAKDKGYWVVVGMHKVCLTVGEKHCEIGEGLYNYLIKRRVNLILHGHDHLYARSQKLRHSSECKAITNDRYDADCISSRGTVDIIVGTGGKALYDIQQRPALPYFKVASWHGDNLRPAFGPLIVEVSDDQLLGDYLPNDGSPGDTFTITRQ